MSASLSLSFELICLMGWLLKHEKTTLNALVQQAMKNGLGQALKEINPDEYAKLSEELHATILDFLFYLEETLAYNLDKTENSEEEKIVITQKIAHPLKKLNYENIDHQTLKMSVRQAKAELSEKKSESLDPDQARQLLYEHIMKNWKPSKNEVMN